MKFCKKIISLILAVLMATSVVVPTYASAYAAEQQEYEFETKLLKENVQFLKETFLSDLDITKQDFYIEYLSEMNHEDEETFLTVAQDTVNRIQSKWSKVLKYLPSNISDSQFSLMGNNIFSYINGTIDVFKNFGYIKSDTRISQKIYHGLRAVNLALDMAKIPTGLVGLTLKVLEKAALVTDFLYVTFMDELVQIQVNNYAQTLYIDYWAGLELNPPSKDDVAALNWSDEWVNNYYAGACEQYLLYSLKQMSSNYEQSSTLSYGKKLLYGGHTYQIIDVSMNWYEAKEYCEKIGGHLATITSEGEQKEIASKVKNCQKETYWLGGTDEGQYGKWEWITGEPFKYTAWNYGEPSNHPDGSNDEFWLEMIRSSGYWNDGELNGDSGIYSLQNHGLICEWDEYIDSIPNVPEIKETHNFVVTNVAPTCTQNGYTLNKCKDCGLEFYSNSVYKLGHDFVFNKKVSPTCTAKGYDLYKCSRCSQTQQQKIVNELGHNYQYSNVVKPTCTEKGYDLYLCTRCGQGNKVKYVDALGHDYSEKPTAHKDPTCNSKGYDEYTCSRCNGTKRDEIAALDGSALTSALDNAKKRMESGVFTDESVSACQKVCDKYQNVVNEFHSQDEVDNATAEVTSAYENLVLKDIVTGTLDNGMTWTFTKDGAKLSFAGEGEVPYYAIGSNPWYYCGILDELDFEEGITSIAKSAFRGYNSVKKVNFPSTLTTIGDTAFECCYSIEELVIPDSVTSIGYGTFSTINALKKVTVPASAKYKTYAFDRDSNIEKIIITPGVDGIMPDCNTVGVSPFGRPYGAFGPWRNANNAVVDIRYGVKSIGKNTFYGAKILRLSVVASVKEIGYQALKTNSNTDVYVYNKDCVIDETNTNLSNVNIMIKDINNEFVKKEHTHIWSWKYNNDAVYNSSTDYTDGTATRTCSACGQSETKTIEGTGLLRANTMNVLLDSNVSVNVGINNSRTAPFESVFFRFEVGGESYDVSDTSELSNSTRTCYAFDKVSPDKFADEITITPYGVTSDGIECKGHPVTYSIKNYCYNQLKKTPNYNLKALLVELLYYGKAHQDYRGYNVENPVTVDLTDEQKKLHTTDTLEYTKVTNSKYQLNPNGTDKNEVEYKSASMLLEGKVIPRIKVEISSSTSINDYTFRWTVDGQNTEFTYAEHPDWFTQTNGLASDKRAYYVDCTVLKADQFSTPFYLTVFKNGTKVSNMLQYSVESYATGSTVKNSPKLKVLIDQMLRYGRAVQKYLNV